MISNVWIFLALPAWFGYRLIRHPQSWALRALVACVVLALADSAPIMDWLRGTFSIAPAAEKLIKNAALGGAWCCLMLFFLFAAGAGLRRAGREIVVLAAVLVTMTVAVLSTPNADAVYPTSPALAASEHLSVLTFYVVGNSYFAYASGSAGLWAARYAAESGRRSRICLRIAAVGLGAFSVAHVARVIMMLAPEATRSWSSVVMPGIGISMWLFVLGVCLAGAVARLAALRVWLRNRRRHTELGPLWTELHHAFPDDLLVLHPHPTWWERLSPRHVHRRFWRRVTECRDGLVQLSPWLYDAGWSITAPTREQAPVLLEALRRRETGIAPTSEDAQLVAVPLTDDLDDDVAELVQLSLGVAAAKKDGAHVPAGHHGS